jgi:DNA-directed RNA polymerase III subunit RPC2
LVFINGKIIGVTNNGHYLVNSLRNIRRKGYIGDTISISIDKLRNMVNISTDEGRLARPLIIVEKGISKLTE